MKKYLKILKSCPLFLGIEDENILKMLSCLGARVESFDKKYTIFAEGSSARYIGILLSGSAQVVQMDYYGNRSILSEVRVSELMAEEFSCAELRGIPVDIIANEPSEVMFIDCSHILYTCTSNCRFHQEMIFNLMKNLASKNIMFHQRIEVTSKRTTREKLMAYLMLCAKGAGSDSFDIPFDRQELADYLEVDRSGLSQQICQLKKDGVIDNRKNHFVLL